ncbi:hypothetical protein D9M68_700360 [compost metagenome]
MGIVDADAHIEPAIPVNDVVACLALQDVAAAAAEQDVGCCVIDRDGIAGGVALHSGFVEHDRCFLLSCRGERDPVQMGHQNIQPFDAIHTRLQQRVGVGGER